MASLVITGHRPQKLGGFGNLVAHRRIQNRIHDYLVDIQPELVYSGMALGVDQWCAASCIKLKIPYIACVPFKNQDLKWSGSYRAEYRRLIKAAAKVVYVDRQPGYISKRVPPDVYESQKMMKRNAYMVAQMEENDVLLAVAGPGMSGTRHTIGLAERCGLHLEILVIDPVSIHPSLDTDDLPF